MITAYLVCTVFTSMQGYQLHLNSFACYQHCLLDCFFQQYFKHSYKMTGFSKHLQILHMCFKDVLKEWMEWLASVLAWHCATCYLLETTGKLLKNFMPNERWERAMLKEATFDMVKKKSCTPFQSTEYAASCSFALFFSYSNRDT